MKDKIDSFGVYRIINTINDKVYIGSTGISFRSRWKNHKGKLRRNTHENEYLQKAYNKYGESAFIYEIIEICHRKEDIVDKERYYWERVPKHLRYNLLEPGTKFNTERSRTNKIVKNKKKRSVISIDINSLAIVNKYESVCGAARELDVDASTIHSCARGKARTAYGFLWVFADELESTKTLTEADKNLLRTRLEYRWNTPTLPVAKMDKNTGEVLGVYASLKDAGQDNNIHESNISKCIHGCQKSAGGFLWSTV